MSHQKLSLLFSWISKFLLAISNNFPSQNRKEVSPLCFLQMSYSNTAQQIKWYKEAWRCWKKTWGFSWIPWRDRQCYEDVWHGLWDIWASLYDECAPMTTCYCRQTRFFVLYDDDGHIGYMLSLCSLIAIIPQSKMQASCMWIITCPHLLVCFMGRRWALRWSAKNSLYWFSHVHSVLRWL